MRIFLLLFFVLNFLTAQKVVKKSLVDSTISSFQIDATNCFRIEIETSNSKEIVVEAIIDGEYKKDLVLNVDEVGSSVLINADFRPNYESPNDKLSAHKVISIALRIQVPAHKNVQVFGTNCNIQASGVYKKLKVTLNDGFSHLRGIEGVAEVSTQSGDILVESVAATIFSNSKYGRIDGELFPNENNKYTLNTVTGNIILKRIE